MAGQEVVGRRLKSVAARIAGSRIAANVVYGAEIASTNLLRAIYASGAADELDLIVVRGDEARANAMARTLPRGPDTTRLRISTLGDLAHWPSQFPPWDIWYDPRPQGDCRGPFNLRARSAARYPIVLTHHSLAYPSYLHSFFLPLHLAGSRVCDAVVCTSKAARRAVEHLLALTGEHLAETSGAARRYKGHLPVIPLGVDVEIFKPRSREVIRDQLRVARDALVLLTVGRISTLDKGDLAPLLGVFAQLRRTNPEVNLQMIVAGTAFDATVEALQGYAAQLGVADAVRFVDPLDPFDAHLWYSAADVFVSPADNVNETFGLTVIEAMACGIPQVVSDWDGYRDTVVDGVTGFLVPTWTAWSSDELDAEALVTGDSWELGLKLAQTTAVDVGHLHKFIELLIRDESLRTRMAIASRKRAVDLYAWPHIAGAYASLWGELGAEASAADDGCEGGHFDGPNFARCFGHYGTGVVEPMTSVTSCHDDLESAIRDAIPPIHTYAASYIRPDVLSAIATAMPRAVARDGGSVAVWDLAQRVNTGTRASPENVCRHVLWMAKHGLVRIGDASHR